MKLEIVQLGDPILYAKATDVEDVASPKTQALIDDLFETLKARKAVGMAAPQAGIGIRLFVVSTATSTRKDVQRISQEFINPVIIRHSSESYPDWEGCMSILSETTGELGVMGYVNRWVWIDVEFLDRRGNAHSERFEGHVARIIQHENDHLDGILFLDWLTSREQLVSGKYYEDVIRKKRLSERTD